MNLPLKGKTVVVTRAAGQAEELVVPLRDLGAEVVPIPTIEIVPPDSWEACDAAIANFDQYHWVIFTSTNGVRFFVRRFQEKGKDIQELNSKRIAAVGERTQADLLKQSVRVDLVPEEFRAEDLVEAFKEINLNGQSLLLPKAQKSREVLVQNLVALGARVDAVSVYKNQPPNKGNFPELQKTLNGRHVHVLTFTSPSTVRNFVAIFGEKKISDWCAKGCCIAVIGGVTATALNEYNLQADIIPKHSTIPSLLQAIAEFYA